MAEKSIKVLTTTLVEVTYKLGEQDPVAAQQAAEKRVGAACEYVMHSNTTKTITYTFVARKG